MLRPLMTALAVFLWCSQSLAADPRGLWCAPEEPEIGVNTDGVSFVDDNCVAKSLPFRLGEKTPMRCSGDSGGFDTELIVTLSGDTLTVTEDGTTTTYTRCK